MPRDGSGNFTLPANTQAVSGDPISSTKFNTLVQDLEADANVDRPIAAGGTGASTALAARANLGLEIGVNVQAFDAGLLSIAGLTTLADRSIYTTASDTYAVYTLTAAGRAILDDADASAQRTTLGLGTAAIVNTGTSGATIPLLNGTNTFSATQTLSGAGLKWATTSTTSADPGFHIILKLWDSVYKFCLLCLDMLLQLCLLVGLLFLLNSLSFHLHRLQLLIFLILLCHSLLPSKRIFLF